MQKSKRFNSFIIAFLFFVTSWFMITAVNPINTVYAAGTTYYVSSSTGNDNNNGTSTGTPWKTIAMLNTITFQAGDTICLKAGDEWNHGFIAKGSGTSASPITLTSYGTGPRPRIKMNNEMLSWCISLTNVAGWKITNLELCNAEQGIIVRVLAGQYNKDYLWVENCYFHDIRIKEFNGYVWDDTTMQWGAGVYIYTNGSQNESPKLKNITIKNCFSDYCDSFFDMAIGDNVNTIKTLTIDGCTAMHSAWNTLSLMDFSTAAGEGCLVKNCVFSTNGGIRSTPFGGTDVMAGNADNTVIDNCEFNNRLRTSDDADGCGFDYEWGCDDLHITNCSFYKNAGTAIYIFNNSAAPKPASTGILIDNCLFVQNLQNPAIYHDTAGEIEFGNSGATGTISNNIFYPLPGKSAWTGPYSGMTFSNNTNPGTKSIVATPTMNVAAGEYSSNQTVTISCATSGAEIRYTIDGSIPTTTSPLYSGPVTVSQSMCLNAKAFKSGWENSQTKSSIYSIRDSKAWEFNTDGSTEGWAAINQINDLSTSGGFLNGNITGSDPYMYSSNNLAVDISNNKYIKVRLKNKTSSTLAQIYFITNTDGTYNDAKSKNFTIVANDICDREYVIDMSTVADWTGTLKQLRFDPNTSVSSGSFCVDYIRISNSGGYSVSTPTISNTGFESPSTSNFQMGPMTYGWTFDGGAGVQRNGSAFGAPDAPEGVQTGLLQASGSFYQSVNFPSTGSFKLYFKVAKRTSYGGTQSFDVYYDTAKIGSYTPSSGSFTDFATSSFVALAGNHTIKFMGTTTGDNTDFFDSILIGQ